MLFGKRNRILVFPSNAEGAILKQISGPAPSDTPPPLSSAAPGEICYVKTAGLLAPDGVVDFVLADFEVRANVRCHKVYIQQSIP